VEQALEMGAKAQGNHAAMPPPPGGGPGQGMPPTGGQSGFGPPPGMTPPPGAPPMPGVPGAIKPEIKFHQDTSILLVSGSAQVIETVKSVLEALQANLEAAPGPDKGGAASDKK
jgi:hypothetical protein